jgi:hypothetical protein
MQIYLLRHGIAEDAKPGHPDSERPLTAEGRDKLRRVLKRGQTADLDPSLILSSPRFDHFPHRHPMRRRITLDAAQQREGPLAERPPPARPTS